MLTTLPVAGCTLAYLVKRESEDEIIGCVTRGDDGVWTAWEHVVTDPVGYFRDCNDAVNHVARVRNARDVLTSTAVNVRLGRVQ